MTREEKMKELILKLEKLTEEKNNCIKTQQYEYAAELRDSINKGFSELEELMNPPGND